eukprot:jgi/Chlat1/2430/Chrsp17S02677
MGEVNIAPEDQHLIPQMLRYLSTVHIDADDPGLLVSWEHRACAAFANAANGLPAQQHPGWVSTLPGQMTAESLQLDIVHHLMGLGGGAAFGHILVAPNTLEEFVRVCMRIGKIEESEFVQLCMAQLPANTVLAHLGDIKDRTQARGTPFLLPAAIHDGIPAFD